MNAIPIEGRAELAELRRHAAEALREDARLHASHRALEEAQSKSAAAMTRAESECVEIRKRLERALLSGIDVEKTEHEYLEARRRHYQAIREDDAACHAIDDLYPRASLVEANAEKLFDAYCRRLDADCRPPSTFDPQADADTGE